MSDIIEHYRVIESGAGWVERANRGRIRIDGADRVPFLQTLVSNDLQAFESQRGVYAMCLTGQGRIIADLTLYDRWDHVLADVPLGATAQTMAAFGAVVFAEDVQLSDVSESTASVAVIGRLAPALLAQVRGIDERVLTALPPLGTFLGAHMFIARADLAGYPVFDVFLRDELRAELEARFAAAGIRPVGDGIADVLRIEAGHPAFGRDMDERTFPLDAGLLDRAISLTKGCYVGHEVIARVLRRGGGPRPRLVKLVFDSALETPPAAGTALEGYGWEGQITSAAWSPRLGRVVALGYVPSWHAKAGETVVVIGDATRRARITGLSG